MATDKQIILITGANSGIGFETSFVFANASPSNHVIMTARSRTKGEAALAELQARKPAGSLSFLELDITSDDSIATATKTVESQFGKLDVLINNAGVGEHVRLGQPSKSLTRPDLRRIFETNVFGAFLLTQSLEPLLRRTTSPDGKACIVNVSSGMGSVTFRADHAFPGNAHSYDAYRMSKSALNMQSMNFRYNFREFARVFAFEPGLVVSNLTGEEDKEVRKSLGAGKPEDAGRGILGIVMGERDDVGDKLVAKKEVGTLPW